VKKVARIEPAKVVKPVNVLQAGLHPRLRPPSVQLWRENLGAPAAWSMLPMLKFITKILSELPEFIEI
jgi:hypothetical protein